MNRRDHELAAHQPWLRRLARRFARSSTRADDLVQETYITALRKAPPDAQLRPWLRSVMRKIAWGQVRSEQRRALREDSFSTVSPPLTMPDLLDDRVDREQLNAALARLPEPFRSTLVERFFKGQSCADIARAEKVPAGTVRWRQARGLEMLRADLQPTARRRRQSAFWALPFVGAGEQLLVRLWQVVTSRGPGAALWLWLAALVIYAISSSSVAPPSSIGAGRAGPHRHDARITVSPVSIDHVDGDATEDDPGMLIRLGDPRQRAATGDPDGPTHGAARRRRSPALTSLDDAREASDADCKRHPNSPRCMALRAAGAPFDQALCDLIRHQVQVGESLSQASTFAQGFLTAAMQANRALARRSGCPWAQAETRRTSGPGRAKDRDPSEAPADPPSPAPPPSCVEQDDEYGLTCTVCPGEPPICAPAECTSYMSIDRVMCTQCRDAYGEYHQDCPLPPSGMCHSELVDGLLCSTCEDKPGEPPECLPAECGVYGQCLRCIDPKGRTGVDCRAGYDQFRGGSSGMAAEGAFYSACSFTWGFPMPTTTSCWFPGPETCVYGPTEDDWHCLMCDYPDHRGGGICGSPHDPFPDPLASRPRDLPPPGQCVTELAANGVSLCTSCTYQDLSAETVCRHPTIESCDYLSFPPLPDDPSCPFPMMCRQSDGTPVRVCNTRRGYQPQ